MKQNGVVCNQDPRSYSLYFDLNISFRARKVSGTFEKRVPDLKTSIVLEVWSENGCGKWHFLVLNSIRIWRTGQHIPTKNSQEYPPGILHIDELRLPLKSLKDQVIQWGPNILLNLHNSSHHTQPHSKSRRFLITSRFLSIYVFRTTFQVRDGQYSPLVSRIRTLPLIVRSAFTNVLA